MQFRDRESAAERLAEHLAHLRGRRPLVLAVPNGGVPLARVVAEALDGDLDVALVRKIGAPGNDELAVGAVDEDGRVSTNDVARTLAVSRSYVEAAAAEELRTIRGRRARLAGHEAVDPAGRTVVVVDDGLATGSTMAAAVASARRRGAHRVIAAAPVASAQGHERVRLVADEVVCLATPDHFRAVGQWYEDFSPVPDDEVVRVLARFREERAHREVVIAEGLTEVVADLVVPASARGLVVFAHGSGSSRKSPRNRRIADALHRRGLATLLTDLVMDASAHPRASGARPDTGVSAHRLCTAAAWAASCRETAHLPLGLFGSGTGAAYALAAAAELGGRVGAVVCRGGRPELVLGALSRVHAPTLLLVGGADQPLIGFNQLAYERLATRVKRLEIVPGASHLFEEPGALDAVAQAAARWFEAHLTPAVAATAGTS